MNLVTKYFPGLTATQLDRYVSLYELYHDWNSKINVISRKDIDNLYLHHVLHSLAIAKFLGDLCKETEIVDVGTGGGFPAIPLAILYPSVHFHLVDRIVKKLKVVNEIASAINLSNVTIQHGDIRECHRKFDYAVSRAAMRLDELVKLTARNISPKNRNQHPNGLVCLKGGDLVEESRDIKFPVIEYNINQFFQEDFFDTKKLVYVPISTKR